MSARKVTGSFVVPAPALKPVGPPNRRVVSLLGFEIETRASIEKTKRWKYREEMRLELLRQAIYIPGPGDGGQPHG